MAAPYTLDSDGDTVSDLDETDAGSDPANPSSLPRGFHIVRIGTKSLVIRDGSQKNLPSKRFISFNASTKNAGAANRITAPARGGPGDPRAGGATLFVYNTGGSGEAVRIPLSPSRWTAKGSNARPAGYVFKAAGKSEPVQQITILNDKLVVKGGREFFAYSLDEPSQGRIAIRLTLGTDVQWCTEATARQDETDKFVANSNTPAPATCPDF